MMKGPRIGLFMKMSMGSNRGPQHVVSALFSSLIPSVQCLPYENWLVLYSTVYVDVKRILIPYGTTVQYMIFYWTIFDKLYELRIDLAGQ
jgi:hypothetical protein